MKTVTRLSQLQALGFDRSRVIPFMSQWRVGCSRCEALVIQGTPTHEKGCPSAMHECAGCDVLLPADAGRYCCEECK